MSSAPVALLFVLAGMGLLAAGGEALVRGAVSLARLLRVSAAVIGLTVVAMGTSAPELAVSVLAASHGRSDIAMGNVIGSSLFNVAVIIGASAVVVPIAVHLSAVRLEWPVMALISVATLLLAYNGVIDRLEGAALLVTLGAFTAYAVRVARRDVSAGEAAELAASVAARSVRSRSRQAAIDAALIVGGIAFLVAGAQVLVRGAVTLAALAGMSDRVIGLTVVAAGTSMPELATCIVAARRKQAEIALANAIGSNIFNLAGILGVVSLLTPQTVNLQAVRLDLPWMIGYAVLLYPLMRTGMRISRLEGAALIGTYGVYLALVLRR